MYYAWYYPPNEQPRGHRAPSVFPWQTNRDLADNHEEYLMWIVLLLFPCTSPEHVGSCAPGELSVGFRVGCGCQWSAAFQANMLSGLMRNKVQ